MYKYPSIFIYPLIICIFQKIDWDINKHEITILEKCCAAYSQTINCHVCFGCSFSLSNLALSFKTEKQQSRATLNVSDVSGLCAGTRISSLKLMQSRFNWASSNFVMVVCSSLEFGFAFNTAFERSGNNLLQTSMVDLQEDKYVFR